MNVFEYAKKMEMDGINYYKQEAELTNLPGLKKILELLIHQEQKHYELFDALEKNPLPEN